MKLSWRDYLRRVIALALALLIVVGSTPIIGSMTVNATEENADLGNDGEQKGGEPSGAAEEDPEDDPEEDPLEERNPQLPETYSVNVSVADSDGGSVTASYVKNDNSNETVTVTNGSLSKVPKNTEVTITVTPNDGYDVDAIKQGEDIVWSKVNADGGEGINKLSATKDPNGAVSFTCSLTTDVSFSVSFSLKEYTITYTITGNGKITLNSDSTEENDKIELSVSDGNAGTTKVKHTNSAYKVTASVTDQNYHITSFQVDGTEQLTTTSNETESCDHTFENGIIGDHTISVTAAIDTYKVTVSSGENGTVYGGSVSDENKVSGDNGIIAEIGSNVSLIFVPNEDYQISELKIGGQEVSYNSEDDMDDGYHYTISNIKADTTVDVNFLPIKSQEIEELEENQITVTNENGATFSLNNNTYYGGRFQLKHSSWNISFSQNGGFSTNVSISEEQILHAIYVRISENFGAKHKYTFNNTKFVIDTTKPSLSFSKDGVQGTEFYVDSETTSVKVSGTVDEANLDYVIYTTTKATDGSAPAKTSGTVVTENALSFKDVELTLSKDVSNNSATDTFYFYAVDKAGNYSETPVTIYRDGNAPEVTAVQMTASSMNSQTFGNYTNDAVTLTITANDIAKASDAAVNASGIKAVNVYAGENATEACYTGRVTSGIVHDNNSVELSVTIRVPENERDAFFSQSTVYITAVDAVGNESEKVQLKTKYVGTDESDTLSSSDLMIDNTAPTVTAALSTGDIKYSTGSGNEAQNWYSDKPSSLTISGDDKNGSGLASYEIKINDSDEAVIAVDLMAGVAAAENVTKSTNEISISAADLFKDQTLNQGANTVTVTFTDLAGNSNTVTKTFYYDDQKPTITKFDFQPVSSSKMLNLLGIGTFANDQVKITVTASDIADDHNADHSSGVKTITLNVTSQDLLTESQEYTEKVGSDGTATFTLPAAALGVNSKYYYGSITATATDHVELSSDATAPTTANSNIKSSTPDLMIENIAPTVEIVAPEEDTVVKTNGDFYISKHKDVTISVTDADSGIASVTIEINGAELINATENTESKITTKTYTVNTGDTKITEKRGTANNLYELTSTIVDNAGNVTVKTQNIYLDEDAPVITEFTLSPVGSSDAPLSAKAVEEKDYGYFFRQKTNVTIKAKDLPDGGAVGVHKIVYYTVDSSGKQSAETEVPTTDSITFTVEAGFKGQLYAYAVDELQNTAEPVNPDGLIIETQEQHDKDDHITLGKAETSYSDADGNELYANDVPVKITVTDTFSGIEAIEWAITSPYDKETNTSGTLSIDENGAVSGDTGWTVAKTDLNLVTEISKTVTASADSNGIQLNVKMTDRSGNTSEKTITFSIDKTKPEITLTFNKETSGGPNPTMYNTDRIATIVVKERNFDAENFTAEITNTDEVIPSLSSWTTLENTSNPNETTSTATIIFSDDGDYTMLLNFFDMAHNDAAAVSEEEFTIDKTAPVIAVSYSNNNANNGNYYAQQRVATVSIEEHNFDASQVVITGTASDGGAVISFPATSGFTSNENTNTATITFSTDGLYRFDVAFTDMAGNEAQVYIGEEFYIDTTAPSLTITGVEDLSANNGDVIPVISMSDTNYNSNGVDISITGANRGTLTADGTYTGQADGQVFTFNNFPTEQGYDDIYVLAATVTDLAGNETSQSIMFSVNRFGSVYVFDDTLKDIKGTYIQNEIDVKLTEVNVDSLEHDKIRVVLDQNGTPRDLVEGTDYTVEESGGNGSWYRYDYTINKSLFAGDGRYIITLYSQDAAGNTNENIDETKEAEISFGIDKTAPVIVPIDIESNTQYAVDVKSTTISVVDNLVLQDVAIYVGGQSVEYTSDGDNYTFEISNSTKQQEVQVVAYDAAGNMANYVIDKVLVTTNIMARWYNNKPVFVGSIVGTAGVGGAGAGATFLFRRRRIKIKLKK
jgi:hypothetical protein